MSHLRQDAPRIVQGRLGMDGHMDFSMPATTLVRSHPGPGWQKTGHPLEEGWGKLLSERSLISLTPYRTESIFLPPGPPRG